MALTIHPDWPLRLLRYMREDFTERRIEGRPIKSDSRELYYELARLAMERKLELGEEACPDFLRELGEPK